MRRFGGAAALAVGLSMMMTPVAVAGPTADATASAPEAAQLSARGKKCATRQEYRRIDVKGKDTSRLREVRRIIGSNGKRVSMSHAEGHKWEIRKYPRCDSKILHVYVNYRDNKAYDKNR